MGFGLVAFCFHSLAASLPGIVSWVRPQQMLGRGVLVCGRRGEPGPLRLPVALGPQGAGVGADAVAFGRKDMRNDNIVRF